MSKLSKRLSIIADLVDSNTICDVGCDHGKLVKYLLDEKKIKFAYVSDISMQSLKKAINLLANHESNFEAICCDGLKGYKDKLIDECVISGMGGEQIIDIIKSSPISIQKFILSPQHNIIKTKKFMLENNYNITFDIIIKDKNKFYNVFKCEKTQNKVKLNEYQLIFGKDNFTNLISDIDEYVIFELNKLYAIKHQTKNSDLNYKIDIFEKAKKERKL